jgi:hypothetical protein
MGVMKISNNCARTTKGIATAKERAIRVVHATNLGSDPLFGASIPLTVYRRRLRVLRSPTRRKGLSMLAKSG